MKMQRLLCLVFFSFLANVSVAQTTSGDCSPVVQDSDEVTVNCKETIEPYPFFVLDLTYNIEEGGDQIFSNFSSKIKEHLSNSGDEPFALEIHFSPHFEGLEVIGFDELEPEGYFYDSYDWRILKFEDGYLGWGYDAECGHQFDDRCYRYFIKIYYWEDEFRIAGIPPRTVFWIRDVDMSTSRLTFVNATNHVLKGFYIYNSIGGGWGRSVGHLDEPLLDPQRAAKTLENLNSALK